MTEKELREAADKLATIETKRKYLQDAQNELRLINRFVAENKTWTVDLELEPSNRYGYNRITTQFKIPIAMVQQQAVDKVRAAERELVLAGGTL